MRIFYVNTFFSAGGSARVVGGISEELRRGGHDCMIAAARGTEPSGRRTLRVGSRLSVCFNAAVARIADNDGFMAHRATRRLVDAIERYSPDVVHLHNLHGYYVNVELLFDYLRRSGKRVVWTLHDCWAMTGHCPCFSTASCEEWLSGCRSCVLMHEYPKCFFGGRSAENFRLKKSLFTGIDNLTLVVPSRWLASIVSRSYLSDYPLRIIPNGVDTMRFRPVESDFRSRYGIGSRTMLLSVASSWVGRKGFGCLAELAKMLDDSYAIVVIGITEAQRRLLPEGIVALPAIGSDELLAQAYSAADLLVNLSTEESFGLVTLEALACGTPVVVYDATACPEPLMPVFEPLADGHHAKPFCSAEAAIDCGVVVDMRRGVAGVAEMVSSGAWRTISKEACRRHALGFDAHEVYSRYIALYDELNKEG